MNRRNTPIRQNLIFAGSILSPLPQISNFGAPHLAGTWINLSRVVIGSNNEKEYTGHNNSGEYRVEPKRLL